MDSENLHQVEGLQTPQRLRDVTPEWLTQVLRSAGVLGGERVAAFEVEAIGEFSNQLWRLPVRYDRPEPGLPNALVLKRPKPDRDAFHTSLADEIRFYRDLGQRVPVRTPRLYFGEVDGDSGRELLLMEEIPGFVRLDWRAGAEPEHAERALRALAQLHAWGAKHTDGQTWVPDYADTGYRQRLAQAYDAHWAEKRAFLAAVVPDFVETGDALAGRVESSLATLGAPSTLLHGDAHFENLAWFDPGDGSRDVLFHDWAMVARGIAAFDVAVFTVMSYPVEQRRALEQSHVELHARALREAGDSSVTDPWLAYRRGVLAWSVHMLRFARRRESVPLVPEMYMVVERVAAAAVDHRIAELIL